MACTAAISVAKDATEQLQVGDEAPALKLQAVNGEAVELSNLIEDGPVVLIVLRGNPGYQCPLCSRQVGQFMAAAEKLTAKASAVVFVYPGAADGLKDRAQEFLKETSLPKNFHFLLDPDYAFTTAWNLRWDAPRETAYPSTFVIDADGQIAFAKISQTHAGRSTVEEVLKVLPEQTKPNNADPDGDTMSATDIFDRVRQHQFHPLDDGFTKDAVLGRHGIADLANQDWRVRTLAVRDLVRLGPPAVPELLAALSDDDLHVRHAAALVLGILPEAGISGEQLETRRRGLIASLATDQEPVVRSEAAIALGRVGDAAAIEPLQAAAKADASRDVRHQCVVSLDQLEKSQHDQSLYNAYRGLDETRFNVVTVNRPAPEFTLDDTNGVAWRLSDFLGRKHIVLVWIFADWCPVCHGEFRDLLRMREEFQKHDIEIVTVQCHEAYRCRVMVGREVRPKYWFSDASPQAAYGDALWWRHLSDPAGAVAALYGAAPLAFAVHSEYINRPTTVIIDKGGVVRFAYHGTFWGDRPTIEQTLEMVRSGDYAFVHPKRLSATP